MNHHLADLGWDFDLDGPLILHGLPSYSTHSDKLSSAQAESADSGIAKIEVNQTPFREVMAVPVYLTL